MVQKLISLAKGPSWKGADFKLDIFFILLTQIITVTQPTKAVIIASRDAW